MVGKRSDPIYTVNVVESGAPTARIFLSPGQRPNGVKIRRIWESRQRGRVRSPGFSRCIHSHRLKAGLRTPQIIPNPPYLNAIRALPWAEGFAGLLALAFGYNRSRSIYRFNRVNGMSRFHSDSGGLSRHAGIVSSSEAGRLCPFGIKPAPSEQGL